MIHWTSQASCGSIILVVASFELDRARASPRASDSGRSDNIGQQNGGREKRNRSRRSATGGQSCTAGLASPPLHWHVGALPVGSEFLHMSCRGSYFPRSVCNDLEARNLFPARAERANA
jgi:hypothetical protein